MTSLSASIVILLMLAGRLHGEFARRWAGGDAKEMLASTSLQSLREEWLRDWQGKTAMRRALPGILIVSYWLVLLALGGLRSDHLLLGGLILLLAYGGPRLKPVLYFALPFFLTGVIYDSMRYYEDYLRGPIHVAEPYHFDLRYFGIPYEGHRLTPNEWWQLHTTRALDFLTGLAYLTFIAIYVLTSAYFRFFHRDEEARHHARGMPWAFLAVNLIGYSTYYWFAAAPPWYVARYGLGPARLDVHASSAGAARFDALLGTHFFSDFYGRSADVFGAVPSLHVSYPLIAALFATRYKKFAPFCWAFYFWMCFSAIYLNHHYVLDILWGSSYAVMVTGAIWALTPVRSPVAVVSEPLALESSQASGRATLLRR